MDYYYTGGSTSPVIKWRAIAVDGEGNEYEVIPVEYLPEEAVIIPDPAEALDEGPGLYTLGDLLLEIFDLTRKDGER